MPGSNPRDLVLIASNEAQALILKVPLATLFAGGDANHCFKPCCFVWKRTSHPTISMAPPGVQHR